MPCYRNFSQEEHTAVAHNRLAQVEVFERLSARGRTLAALMLAARGRTLAALIVHHAP